MRRGCQLPALAHRGVRALSVDPTDAARRGANTPATDPISPRPRRVHGTSTARPWRGGPDPTPRGPRVAVQNQKLSRFGKRS